MAVVEDESELVSLLHICDLVKATILDATHLLAAFRREHELEHAIVTAVLGLLPAFDRIGAIEVLLVNHFLILLLDLDQVLYSGQVTALLCQRGADVDRIDDGHAHWLGFYGKLLLRLPREVIQLLKRVERPLTLLRRALSARHPGRDLLFGWFHLLSFLQQIQFKSAGYSRR